MARKKWWWALFLLLLTLIPLLWLKLQSGDMHRSAISLEEIPNILKSTQPIVPNDWTVTSVKKYDDGFTSPTVEITYDNGVALILSNANLTFPDMTESSSIIGRKNVSVFTKGKQVVYQYKDSLEYTFKATDTNGQVIVDFIQKTYVQ